MFHFPISSRGLSRRDHPCLNVSDFSRGLLHTGPIASMPTGSAREGLQRILTSTALATGVIVALTLFQPSAAQAQSFWAGTTSDYGTAPNWNPNTVATLGVGGVFDNSVAGFTTVDLGAVTFTPSTWTINGNTAFIIQNGTANFTGSGLTNTSSATQTISAILGGAGAGVTQSGMGMLILTGANTYTGATRVNAGILRLGAAGVIPNASAVVVNGGTLDLNNFTETVGSLSGAGGTIATGGATGRLNVNQAGAGTYAGGFSGATGGNVVYLEKQGAGTLTLSGANTTTGAGRMFVTGGTLALQGGNAIGDNNVLEVNPGTTADIQASETIGALLGGVGGTIALNASTLTLAGLGAGSVATAFLTITGTGGLTINGANFAQAFTQPHTYTSATTILNGTLQLDANNIIADGSSVVVNGASAALNIQSFTDTVASVSLQTGSIAGTTGVLTSLTDVDARSGSISAILGGAAGLEKTTAGTVTLSGANTFTGATTVNAGALRLQNTTALGTTAGGTTVAAGAALELQGGIFVPAEALTLSGTGIGGGGALRNISGNNVYNGVITLASNTRIISDAGQLDINGGIIGAGQHLTVGGAGNMTLANITTAASLTKDDIGVLGLSGVNTYTGRTTVNDGTVQLTGGTAIADTGAVVVYAPGIVQVVNTETIGSLAGGGNVVLMTSAALTTGGDNTSTIYSGVLSQSGGGGSLIKQGTGTFTLSAANTYAGATTINAGALNIQNAAALGTVAGGTTVAAGAALELQGGIAVVAEALTLSGTGVAADGALRSISGTNSFTGAITLASASRINSDAGTLTLSSGVTGAFGLTVGGAGNTTISGAIATGAGGLTKDGAGLLLLSGANTFTGATQVNGGKLLVNGSLASSTVTVGTGATLGGSGTMAGAVTITSGGTLSAGNSPGTLTVASLALNSGSNTVFELNTPGVTGGATNDHIIVNGSGAAGNLTLGGTLTANVASAGYYRLFDVTGGGTISGSFSSLALTAPSVAGATGTVYSMPAGVPPQVNLAVLGVGQILQFWDGADQAGNGAVNGGAGTWNSGNTNWAVAPGEAGSNAPWLNSVGVFQGTAGTVSVSGSQSFDTLQFNSDGYVLTGGSLGFGVTGGGTINTASGVTVSIGSAITDGVGTSLTKVGAGTLILTGTNTYSGGTTIGGGTLRAGSASAIGTGPLTLAGGTFQAGAGFINTFATAIAVDTSGGAIDVNGQVVTLTGNITDGNGAGGVLSLLNSSTDIGRVDLGGSNSYSGPTAIGGGVTLAAAANGAFSPNSDVTLVPNAALMANGHAVTVRSLAGSGLVVNGHDTQAGSLTLAVSSGTASFVGSIADNAPGETGATLALTKTGAGTQILAGANSYTGGTTILGGTLQIGAGGTSGSITGDVANGGTLVFNRSDAVSFGGTVSGSGALRQAGTGTTTLTGISSYTGTTFVDAGTLVVNGSIATSSGVTVAAGGSVGGTGTLPSLTVNGTLAPGNSPGTLTVNGNLVLGAGSTYVAEVQGAVSDRVNVTGTAVLAGTLRLAPLGGAYLFSAPYTLLSAAGGRTGSFSPVDTTGTFGDGVTTSVAYTATDVQLTLTPKPLAPIVEPKPPVTPPDPAPGAESGVGPRTNASAIAAGIDRAVAGGANPSLLFAIYNLPAAAIPAALNQLSGEVHTAAPAMAHVASDQFLRTMLDGSGAGRLSGAPSDPGGAAGFTADLPSRQDGPGRPSFDPARFSLWGATFGSTGRNDGDRAAGSAHRNLSDGHVAVGADIRLGSNTVAGVAVAGGQSRASLSRGLGKAQADVFQAGLYGRTTLGMVNLAAALGYARLDTDTTRAIPALSRSGVSASYATQAWSGRIEANLPVATWHGLTLSPFAAFQAVRASSPAAVERDGMGATAGMLTLARRSDMTSRSELGLQLDTSLIAGATPVTGFVRAAWGHYYQRDAELSASLNGLPGASFTATGARPDRNAALLAAGADIRLSQSVSLGMRVDSELSANTRRVGGTAKLSVSF
ncbi:MAG: autotransporter-associated beta strand repeat-containing protein [Kaiparowitsia implicata GSE-PSE-MK54-09C]|nr:autotransporter-associated beta strand repeat-containing protein [Kaiparowitsia implicata GSE-PSE-MK54-09C]